LIFGVCEESCLVFMGEDEALSLSEVALTGMRAALRNVGYLSASTYRLTRGFVPLLKLVASESEVAAPDLTQAIDAAFEELYRHPLTRSTGMVTSFLRSKRLLPNEESTENLIRLLVDQVVKRSPVSVPEPLVQEFWRFFDELFASPELKGLGEVSFDMTRLVLRTYEPTLLEVINLLKGTRRHHSQQTHALLGRATMVRGDLVIVRRQVRALRHIREFFQTDPKDFKSQARIVAQMVREFGPFFIKMAQVAAANANFLPDEIARELAVFHEDVPPMDESEVNQAFLECYGQLPDKLFMDFDAAHPVRSGSIGSVYLAKKPFQEGGREVLRQVVIKVGRHNLDREFTMGKLVLGLAILSSRLWAPHSKLEPFLLAMQQQVDEFVKGFLEELDFDAEAENHLRFYRRSLFSRAFKVPVLYGSTHRILEMEYLADARGLTRAIASVSPSERRRFQAKVFERLLYTILSHLVLYGELHGDLHPGNIMLDEDGELHLIDWGNVIQVRGKWRLVGEYLTGALLADTGRLTDALVQMSVRPDESAARRKDIQASLDALLRKRGVRTLTRRNFLSELRRGRVQGLLQRAKSVLHLMGNTQQVGVVLSKDYLHLSRSLLAAAGSFGALYENTPKTAMLRDALRFAARLPFRAGRDVAQHQLTALRRHERPDEATRRGEIRPD
jgi:ubiquinone biosynthesis protein